MAFAIVGAVSAGIAAVGGVVKAVDGGIKAKRAKEEAARAKVDYEKNKKMFASLDTSNPYLNMENTMEDVTVNQQEAEFMKQQQMQQQANVMDTMRGAAGGSGIAALAQTMAGQGALGAQRAAASIGQQESANQRATAQEASRIQGMERQGEVYSRGQEQAKVQGLLGMSQQEMATAKAEQAAGTAQMYQGIGEVAQAGADYASGDYGPTPQGRAELSAEDAAWNAANPDKRQRKGQMQYGSTKSGDYSKEDLAKMLNDEELMKEYGYTRE